MDGFLSYFFTTVSFRQVLPFNSDVIGTVTGIPSYYRIIKIIVFLFFMIYQSVSAYNKHYGQENDSTSYLAHCSGLSFGFLIGFIALENRNRFNKNNLPFTFLIH